MQSECGTSFIEYLVGLVLLVLVLAIFGEILLRAVQSDYDRNSSNLNDMSLGPMYTATP